MSYSICMYYIENSCSYLCEDCIKKMTTKVELDYLNGVIDKYDMEYWPVREKDGSTKKSPRGAVVMKKITTPMKNPQPRTFDGERIHAYSEYSYGEQDGEGLNCECGAELLEPYQCNCKACGEKVQGAVAQKLDYTCKYVYCEDCLEKLVKIKQIPEKIEDLYKKLLPVAIGKKPRVNLGKNAHYFDAYGHILEAKQELENSAAPSDFKEYVDAQLEKYEYLANRDGGVAQTIFNLFEMINEFTYIIEEIDETVWWNEIEEVEEMQRIVKKYHDYGYC